MSELEVVRDGGVLTLWLNRPEVLNALSRSLRRQIMGALEEAEQDDAVSCVVLRGRGGRAFSSGQDLRETQDMPESETGRWIDDFDELYHAIRSLSKVSVAAIEGWAAGAGLQVALLCDLRVASAESKLGMPELRVGIPCITGTGLMWPIIGEARARELIFAGGFVAAEKAEQWGLVNNVFPESEFDDRLRELAASLCELPRTAVRLTKAWMRELNDPDYRRTVSRARELHIEAFASGEPKSAMSSFLQRRA